MNNINRNPIIPNTVHTAIGKIDRLSNRTDH